MKRSRRVVVTGLGVVAASGIGKDEFWNNTFLGKSFISRISQFDASKYPCQLAGEIKGFDASVLGINRLILSRKPYRSGEGAHS